MQHPDHDSIRVIREIRALLLFQARVGAVESVRLTNRKHYGNSNSSVSIWIDSCSAGWRLDSLAAARSRATVTIDEALLRELLARHWLRVWVRDAHVREISIVVGDANDPANDARGALDSRSRRAHEFSSGHLVPPMAAALCVADLPRRIVVSNKLKILEYSSVHESGRKNPWSSTG